MSIFDHSNLPSQSVHIPQESTHLNHKQIIPNENHKVKRRLGYAHLGDYNEFSLDLYMVSVRGTERDHLNEDERDVELAVAYPNNSANFMDFEYVDISEMDDLLEDTDINEDDFENEEQLAGKLDEEDIENLAVKYLNKYGDHLRTVEDELSYDTVERLINDEIN